MYQPITFWGICPNVYIYRPKPEKYSREKKKQKKKTKKKPHFKSGIGDILTQVATWMNFENILLGETN